MTDDCPTCGQKLPSDLPLHVDLEVNVAVANGVAVALTGMQAELLSLLVSSSSRTVSKALLMANLYPMNDEVHEKILDVMICKMRPSLARAGVIIDTVWGRGFRVSCERKKAD